MSAALNREQFLADVKDHVMTIVCEDGLYRHLRFKSPGSSCMYFDLLTYPGGLLYRGDMGTFCFERTDDMFAFFRTDGGRINPGYWSEKLTAVGSTSRHPVVAFSEEKFTRTIKEIVLNWIRETAGRTDREQRRELWDAVLDEVLGADFDSRGDRMLIAANDFHHKVADGLEFTFYDIWDYNFTEYTNRFLWCCHALVWGIQQYDRSSGA